MRPANVPSHPDEVWKGDGWQGWGHWLGTGSQSSKTKKEQFLPFDEALRAARQLRLVSSTEWRLWCRTGARPANVPARPDQAYAHDGWVGWVHWLSHANLDAATAPDATSKREAAGGAGKSRGKRRRL